MDEQMQVPDDLIEIHDPEIDPQAILDQIRGRVTQRRQELGHETVFFPSFDGAQPPPKPRDIPYNPELYHHLYFVNKGYSNIDTEPILVSSPATQIPLIGPLWGKVRLFAHQLVLFYVNRAVEHHIEVNRHLVSVANALATDNQNQQHEIVDLQATVRSLQARVDRLQAADSTGD